MSTYIYCYSTKQEDVPSAFRLRNACETKLGEPVKIVCSTSEKPAQSDTIINWGYRKVPGWFHEQQHWINAPECVANAIHKLQTFHMLTHKGIQTPAFTSHINVAMEWQAGGSIVLARCTATGHDGEGIFVVRPGDQLPVGASWFYTMYVPKQREYRLSVVGSTVVDTQQKKVKQGFEQTKDQKLLRTSAGGWLLCRDDIVPVTNAAKALAILAVKALGLQFGGVDLMIGKHGGAYILEINTAPEIFDLGAKRYANALISD